MPLNLTFLAHVALLLHVKYFKVLVYLTEKLCYIYRSYLISCDDEIASNSGAIAFSAINRQFGSGIIGRVRTESFSRNSPLLSWPLLNQKLLDFRSKNFAFFFYLNDIGKKQQSFWIYINTRKLA